MAMDQSGVRFLGRRRAVITIAASFGLLAFACVIPASWPGKTSRRPLP